MERTTALLRWHNFNTQKLIDLMAAVWLTWKSISIALGSTPGSALVPCRVSRVRADSAADARVQERLTVVIRRSNEC